MLSLGKVEPSPLAILYPQSMTNVTMFSVELTPPFTCKLVSCTISNYTVSIFCCLLTMATN